MPGRCNYDTLSPKRNSNITVMDRRTADEAVLIVKLSADEGMVTYLRRKLTANSSTELKVKGGTCEMTEGLIKPWLRD